MSVLSWMRTLAGAVSHADMGPFAGAPRNPQLRVGDEKSYSTIHHASVQTEISALIAARVQASCRSGADRPR